MEKNGNCCGKMGWTEFDVVFMGELLFIYTVSAKNILISPEFPKMLLMISQTEIIVFV